jgi:hypothetical protein
MLAAGSENPSALATNLGNNGNLLHTPSGGYVAARMLQFAGFTFGKFASAYVTPWHGYPGNNAARRPPDRHSRAGCDHA